MRRGMRFALCLTLSRVLLGPLFLIVYTYPEKLQLQRLDLPFVLLAILFLSELSDVLDGIVARKTNQVSDLGKLLDPMADSMFRMSVFFSLTGGIVQLPLVLVILFFYRDSAIGTLRVLCALKGVTLGARTSGKIKAIVQATVAFLIVILMITQAYGWISEESLQRYSFYATLAAVLYSLSSGVEYLIANRAYVKRSLKL